MVSETAVVYSKNDFLGRARAVRAGKDGLGMELYEALRRRRTTNGPFLPDRVSPEHQRMLVEVAAMAPSHLNSQPWRFVLVDDRDKIQALARESGESMTQVFRDGTFFKRYRPYFRFSKGEMEEKRDGIYFDQLPSVLKPFTRHVFSPAAQILMNRLGVPKTLGEDNRKLVAGSPLLLAVLLDKTEYRPGELSGFYSIFGMGAAVENIWLMTSELGMGIQFISFPMEVPESWKRIQALLEVPDDLELMAVYRLGYLPEEKRRPAIDWTSSQRKRLPQYVFRNSCATPEPEDAKLNTIRKENGR